MRSSVFPNDFLAEFRSVSMWLLNLGDWNAESGGDALLRIDISGVYGD